MDSLDYGLWRYRYLCRRMQVRVFRSFMLLVMFYGCETWTLTRDLRWRLNSFGTRSLRRILGYRWSDFVSIERLLRDTQMRFVTCIVREHQLRYRDMWLISWRWSCSPDSFSEGVSWLDEANGPTKCLVAAAGWFASQGDGDGPGICLGDVQTESTGVLVESGRSDALLRCMLPYQTWPDQHDFCNLSSVLWPNFATQIL